MSGTNISIVDVISDRLRKDPIGGLIQEDDLRSVVQEALHKTFFADRYVTENLPIIGAIY